MNFFSGSRYQYVMFSLALSTNIVSHNNGYCLEMPSLKSFVVSSSVANNPHTKHFLLMTKMIHLKKANNDIIMA